MTTAANPSTSFRMLMIGAVLFLASPVAAHAQGPSQVQVVRQLLAVPDSKIDFARDKLAIDKLIDPSIDVAANLRAIDAMVATVRAMAGLAASPILRLRAVRQYIYVDGPWNGHHPYQYDMSDPLGTKLVNKLLPHYLATRKGNCVSMPVLFLILADRLGVHVTLSTAPFHVFVKYVDDATGNAYNLETTSGGHPSRDEWYRQTTRMTDDAVRNGVYLKTLSRKETLVVMAESLLEFDRQARRYRDAVDVARVLTGSYPQDVDILLSEGSAYAGLIDTQFRRKYSTSADIPRGQFAVYQSYARQNEVLFDRAEALGWRDFEHKATVE